MDSIAKYPPTLEEAYEIPETHYKAINYGNEGTLPRSELSEIHRELQEIKQTLKRIELQLQQ